MDRASLERRSSRTYTSRERWREEERMMMREKSHEHINSAQLGKVKEAV